MARSSTSRSLRHPRSVKVTARTVEREAPGATLPPEGKRPKGLVRLDFEIRGGLPGAHEEWEVRAVWLGHVRAHAESLAAVAIDRTRGEPEQERTKLAARRLRAMLRQGHATLGSHTSERLDLVTPSPEMKPWPPAFAGEPIPQAIEMIMAYPLRWEDVSYLAAWARAIAYYASGVQFGAPPAVQSLARERLRRLIDAARMGLAVDGAPGALASMGSASAAPTRPTRKRRRSAP
jgi:hypothetical protein